MPTNFGSPSGSGGGAGTEYTEGATDTTITGVAILWEDAADTLSTVSEAKPLPVEIVAGSSSGTEYLEGDTDASIAGTAIMWEDAADTLRAVSEAKPLPVNIVAGSSSGVQYEEGATDATITGTALMFEGAGNALVAATGDATNGLDVDVTRSALPTGASTSAKQDTIIGHVDGIEGLLTTIDADTSNLSVVGSGTEATAIRVTIATDSTGVLSIDDNGGVITVDGTVVVGSSALPTGAATEAKQDTIIGHVNGVEALLGTIDADTSNLSVVGSGTEATAIRVTIATDSTGLLSVDDNGNSLTVDNAILSVVGSGTEATAQRVTIATDSTGVLSVDDNGSTLSIDDGGGVITVDGTVIVAGAAADGAGVSGNPVLTAGNAVATDGTTPTSVDEGDVATIRTDLTRRVLVNTAAPFLFRVNENHATAQTNNQLKAAPGASLSLYITDIIISNGATAGTVQIVEDEGGTPAVLAGPYYFGINGGISSHLMTPIRLTADKSLGFTSATVTTHSITILGYTAP